MVESHPFPVNALTGWKNLVFILMLIIAFGLRLWPQSALEDFPLSPKLANIWLDWHSVQYFKQIYR